MIKLASVLIAAFAVTTAHAADEPKPWKEIQRYTLGGAGGWDLLSVDALSRRAFVTRGDRLLVVDLDSGKAVGEIPGLSRAHGVAIVPSIHRGYVGSGGDDRVVVFDLDSLKTETSIVAGKSPDAIVFDETSRHVFVFNGHGNSVTVIDPATDHVAATIELSGNPELAVTDGRGVVFVNLESKSQIARIDAKTNKVLGVWDLGTCKEPTGLAIDREHRRLFSVCANRQMAVVDADSGRIVATLPIGDGPDGATFDAATATAFSSNVDGTLTVVHENDLDHFTVATVPTPARSRAIALDEKTHCVVLPMAQFDAAPKPTPNEPHPKPAMKENSFGLLIVGQP